MIINLCCGGGGGSTTPPVLESIEIIDNGVYTPPNGVDGYNEVTVNVDKNNDDVLDFSVIGYDDVFSNSIIEKYKKDIAYSKQLYDAWDTSKTTLLDTYWGDYNLVYAPLVDMSNVTYTENFYGKCVNLKFVPPLNLKNCLAINHMFEQCESLETIYPLDTSNVQRFNALFNYCDLLQSVPLLDCGSATSETSPFASTLEHLTDIGGFKNLKVSWKYVFLDAVPNATQDSLVNVIDNLYDWSGNTDGKAPLNNGTMYDFGTTHTLKFGSRNLNKLADRQIAVAIAKGWTLT